MSKTCNEALLPKYIRSIVQNFTIHTSKLDQSVKPVWAKFQDEQKGMPGKTQRVTQVNEDMKVGDASRKLL